jgi:putative oxidoreductase
MTTHPTPSVVLEHNVVAPNEPLYALGRVLLAVIFIASGYGKLTGLEGFASMLGSRYGLPAPYALALTGAVVEVVGALAMIIGFKIRWAALALIVFTLIATYLAHRYWTYSAEQVMTVQSLLEERGHHWWPRSGNGNGPESLER